MVSDCFFFLVDNQFHCLFVFSGLTLATARGLKTRILEDARAEALSIRQRAIEDAERTMRQGGYRFGSSEGMSRQRDIGLTGGTVPSCDFVEDGGGGGRGVQVGLRDDGLVDFVENSGGYVPPPQPVPPIFPQDLQRIASYMNALVNYQRGSHRPRRSRGGRGPRWGRSWKGRGAGGHQW